VKYFRTQESHSWATAPIAHGPLTHGAGRCYLRLLGKLSARRRSRAAAFRVGAIRAGLGRGTREAHTASRSYARTRPASESNASSSTPASTPARRTQTSIAKHG
jgi:hypothetical protein